MEWHHQHLPCVVSFHKHSRMSSIFFYQHFTMCYAKLLMFMVLIFNVLCQFTNIFHVLCQLTNFIPCGVAKLLFWKKLSIQYCSQSELICFIFRFINRAADPRNIWVYGLLWDSKMPPCCVELSRLLSCLSFEMYQKVGKISNSFNRRLVK